MRKIIFQSIVALLILGSFSFCKKDEDKKTPPVITTASLPGGIVNSPYSAILTATGDIPITWSVVGSLPVGLSLDASTGSITGTPTAEGASPFNITATNAGGTDTKPFSINVTTGTPPPPTNHFVYNGTTYALSHGYIKTYPLYGTNYNFDVSFVSAGVQWSPSEEQFFGIGERIYLEMWSSSSNQLIQGTYNFSTTKDVFTFSRGSVNIATPSTTVTILGGNVQVAVNGNEYTFTFNLTLQQGTVTGTYKGSLQFL